MRWEVVYTRDVCVCVEEASERGNTPSTSVFVSSVIYPPRYYWPFKIDPKIESIAENSNPWC